MGKCPAVDILCARGRPIRNLYTADGSSVETHKYSLEAEDDIPTAHHQCRDPSNGRCPTGSPILEWQKRAGPVKGLRILIEVKIGACSVESLD
ncbi:hypothetical protein V500_02252 [Pseudogymnoascus sp. VKM F-4518 (FW-2643)]|nr:hypothetical protein V500_02252 [Pseudogymnoascus sp. VKM F-4518 (FW-2643)]